MSRVDDELAKTVHDGESGDAPPLARSAAAPAKQDTSGRNWMLLGVLVMIAAGVGALVIFSFKDAAVYAKSVDQLVASKAQMAGRRVRVEGILVHGSLLKRDNPCEFRFKMEKNGATLDVRYAQCIVPDTFRDRTEADVGVTAEGELTKDGSFEATQIMAKCPSKYEEKNGKKTSAGDPSGAQM